MDSLKIVWSLLAEEGLDQVIEYWNWRNKSDTYSKSIVKNLKWTLFVLSVHPGIAKISSQRKDVHIKVFMSHFLIIYKFDNSTLFILDFWDTRKNPSNNRYF